MYYVLGTGIFALLAIVVVVAFFQMRARNKRYEETGEYED